MRKSTLSFWAVDAFLYLTMDRKYESAWSSELASRVASFVDAYVLFDQVVLPARYGSEDAIKALDPSGTIFEFIAPDKIQHSDDLATGVTLNLSAVELAQDLRKEDYKWFSQHTGFMSRDDYQSLEPRLDVTMAELRLWQHCLINEVAELTGSAMLLPLSLRDIKLPNQEAAKALVQAFSHAKYLELDAHYQARLKLIVESVGVTASGHIENIPPFLTLLIDQALSPHHLVETLFNLRNDYKELRTVSRDFQDEVGRAKTVRGKSDVIREWNDAWGTMLKGDFRAPRLLSAKVSSGDVSKSIFNPVAAASTASQMILDYAESQRSYQRLQIYSQLYNEVDPIVDLRSSLKNKFQLDFTNPL